MNTNDEMVEIVDADGIVVGRGELEDEARWMAASVLRHRGVANADAVAATLNVK
jgi:hypothetical protein